MSALGKYGGGVAIVDDEQSLVEIYRRLLAMKGIPVCFVAYDGDEAIRQFAGHNPKPRIVLLDYRMPMMDGIKTMKKILSIDPGTRVIFISADERVREEALKAGAAMFVQKPASVKEILNAVESVAEK